MEKRIEKIKADIEINKGKNTYSDIIEGLVIANMKVKRGESDEETISSA